MRMSGSYRFDIPRERLWDTLMDPAVVGSCIPGVRAFTPLSPDKYEIELGVSVGPISGAYKCMLEVADKAAPASYRMTVQGAGVPDEHHGEWDDCAVGGRRRHGAELRRRRASYRRAGESRAEAHGQRGEVPD